MWEMSRGVCVNLTLGGGSRSAHHHRPRGAAPVGLFHDDHLLLRIARMAQAVMPGFDFLRSFLRDRTEVVNGAEAIVLFTHA